VHLNYNNYGYLRARNDAESQNLFIENLRYVENQATRTYIWRTFKEMVRTNDLSVKDWIKVVQHNLEYETEEQTLTEIFAEILFQWKYGLINDT
jgi:hypothetical protein